MRYCAVSYLYTIHLELSCEHFCWGSLVLCMCTTCNLTCITTKVDSSCSILYVSWILSEEVVA